jgi:hypothetical protein
MNPKTTRRPSPARPPWPSPARIEEVLRIGERAIEAHQEQAVRLARDVTLGTVTPKSFADETSKFYSRLSSDWAETLRVLFRKPDEPDQR